MHARMTIILVDCTWDDMLRFASTTSVLPEELEVNPKTQGLSVAAFETGMAAPLPPPPLQPTIRKRKTSKESARRWSQRLTRQNTGFLEPTPVRGIVAVPILK
jgi:hypothetical protein